MSAVNEIETTLKSSFSNRINDIITIADPRLAGAENEARRRGLVDRQSCWWSRRLRVRNRKRCRQDCSRAVDCSTAFRLVRCQNSVLCSTYQWKRIRIFAEVCLPISGSLCGTKYYTAPRLGHRYWTQPSRNPPNYGVFGYRFPSFRASRCFDPERVIVGRDREPVG